MRFVSETNQKPREQNKNHMQGVNVRYTYGSQFQKVMMSCIVFEVCCCQQFQNDITVFFKCSFSHFKHFIYNACPVTHSNILLDLL